MRLDELQPAVGSKVAPKRVGRGIGSGNGKKGRSQGDVSLSVKSEVSSLTFLCGQ